MPRAGDGRQPAGDPELGQQGLDSGMQSLARPIAARLLPLAKCDPISAFGAGDGRGGTRRAAANDQDVGIDQSIVREPKARRISTAFPARPHAPVRLRSKIA
jgi:hypothetical protein